MGHWALVVGGSRACPLVLEVQRWTCPCYLSPRPLGPQWWKKHHLRAPVEGELSNTIASDSQLCSIDQVPSRASHNLSKEISFERVSLTLVVVQKVTMVSDALHKFFCS